MLNISWHDHTLDICSPQDLVEYYQQHSLKEGFSSLDTTLQVPYREQSNGDMPRAMTMAKSGECTSHSEQSYSASL